MRLSQGQLICGVEASILRSGLRRLLHDMGDSAHFQIEDLARCVGAPVEEAADLLARMLDADLVRARPDRTGCHLPCDGFFRITAAAINEGISRREADRLMAMLMTKVSEIEANPDVYWYRVTKLAVFGSYLTDAATLGDLDIAFELEPVRDRVTTVNSTKYFEELWNRKTKTEIALRLRRPNKVSLHTFDELGRLGATHRRLV